MDAYQVEKTTLSENCISLCQQTIRSIEQFKNINYYVGRRNKEIVIRHLNNAIKEIRHKIEGSTNLIAKKKFEILEYVISDDFNIDTLANKLNELTSLYEADLELLNKRA